MGITLRTGMAVATQIIKHLCRILQVYRPAMNDVIAAAVSAGHISAAQQLLLNSWLDGAAAACDVIRIVTGY